MSWDPPAEGTESHFDTLLRSLVISRLGRAEDPEVRAEAKRRFDLHASGETPIKADIRSDRFLQSTNRRGIFRNSNGSGDLWLLYVKVSCVPERGEPG